MTNDSLTVSGEVEVSNFPATQDVNVVGGPSACHPPIPTEGLTIICLNESDDCFIDATLIGF